MRPAPVRVGVALPAGRRAHRARPAPSAPASPASTAACAVDLNGVGGKPSTSLAIILGLTVLSVAPAMLLMTTSFTKIFVVLGLTRNALGVTNVPPNQVLAGLALFLTFFIMGPVLRRGEQAGRAAVAQRRQDPDAGLQRRRRSR